MSDYRQQEGLREELAVIEQTNFHKEVWTTLSGVNVNDHVQKKMNLSYLSWAWAWGVLMEYYPASYYEFKPPVSLADGSCEIWVTLTVSNGVNSLSRDMWLPVMDHKNNAIKNPDARKISDTRMRALTKCIALFGLGHYIFAGEDLPHRDLKETVATIKQGIANNDLSSAAEAWFELENFEKEQLWIATTKGGQFTTKEREVIKSTEFRVAYFGDEAAA